MLQIAALALQGILLALIAYNAITALWGWKNRVAAPKGSRRRRLRIVIPAHDEERVIQGILGDLGNSDYPKHLVGTWVIADHCTDRTVDLSRELNADVVERVDGPAGKGAALAWFLDEHPLQHDETLIVFDADNRIGPEVLGRMADEIDNGHRALQCYVDTANPDDSILAESSALSYWAANRMVQLARANLGWSADLSGTGMAFSADLLDDVGGFQQSLTEDQNLGARIVLAGERVEWIHDVKVRDEKPTSVGVAIRQRARWMAGRRRAGRTYTLDLLKTRRLAAFDQALRLVQPGRMFVALLSAFFTVLAIWLGTAWFVAPAVWGTATAIQALEPIPFLAREGLAPRQLVRYPLLLILAVLWIPIRVVSSLATEWYHTPHGDSD
jgi:cellulose synthase/poly-beta-1,6-N-acetylglucosamine synthase-like glycosyltransferase